MFVNSQQYRFKTTVRRFFIIKFYYFYINQLYKLVPCPYDKFQEKKKKRENLSLMVKPFRDLVQSNFSVNVTFARQYN